MKLNWNFLGGGGAEQATFHGGGGQSRKPNWNFLGGGRGVHITWLLLLWSFTGCECRLFLGGALLLYVGSLWSSYCYCCHSSVGMLLDLVYLWRANNKHHSEWQRKIQGSTLTVVCWPLACRNITLASGRLEKLAILACRNSCKCDL